jgi:ATP-dependent Clp protease adaptor protein ClpS
MGRWSRKDEHDAERDDGLSLSERKKTRKPRRFKVLLHNDDFTTTEFVVDVLIHHFHKNEAEATHIMLQVHNKGMGVAGVYPRDQAETKIQDVTLEARAQGMPLLLSMEET